MRKIFAIIITCLAILIGSMSDTYAQVKSVTIAPADTNNYIVKNKIKSLTIISYTAKDSTLKDKKIKYKSISLYDKKGNTKSTISEGGNGKAISRNEMIYNDKNYLVENISLDSAGKITAKTIYYYGDKNKIKEIKYMIRLEPKNDADTGAFYIYSGKYKYDATGNQIEAITDSSGVATYKTISKFDAKSREIRREDYFRKNLSFTQDMVYDANGNYTETISYYLMPGLGKCSPEKNKTINKYDSKHNMIASILLSEVNGKLTTNNTTSVYAYDGDKIVSATTTVEVKSGTYNSKQTDVIIYEYDDKGNKIQQMSRYGGYSEGGISLYKFTYNSKNNIKESIDFGSGSDNKPVGRTVYNYFPDDTTLKEVIYETFGDYGSRSVSLYDDKLGIVESLELYPDETTQVIYQYEFWEK